MIIEKCFSGHQSDCEPDRTVETVRRSFGSPSRIFRRFDNDVREKS